MAVAEEETITETLVAAGANVNVSGNIKGSLKAFGANVTISGNSDGAVYSAAANINLSGRFREKVTARASNVVLSGTFEKDVEVASAKITLLPSAVIKGNLNYVAATLDRREGAQVLGSISQKGGEIQSEKAKKWREKGKKAAGAAATAFWFFSAGALILLGVIINYIFPKQTDLIVSQISDSPWSNIVIGLMFLVVVPVVILIALITVIGIPAAVIAGLIYGVSIYISRVYISVWIGRKIIGFFKKNQVSAFFWQLLVGVIIIALVGLIPYIGWLFKLFCLFISLGALWLLVWQRMSS